MHLRDIWLFLFATSACAQGNPSEFFETRVRPVLANNCYSCHTISKMGGLRVDSREALLQGGKSGPAIVVGEPESSLLIRAVLQSDGRLKMPMAGSKLKDTEIADLKEWVKAGAPWSALAASTASRGASTASPNASAAKKFAIRPEQRDFWSFQPLRKETPPAVHDATWAKTPIDRFVLARLEEKGLKPAPPVDKRTFLRRVSYALIGLPPTPEQVDAFLADTSPGAYGAVVDRLLASPQYGERWGRHWLDVARYADGSARRGAGAGMVFLGYGMARDGYANTWRYRDWVIQALNDDMPYDQFVKAQIAADLMPEKDRAKLEPALGFFGLGPWFTGDDVTYVEARADEIDGKIDAVTKGILGLTVTCARCHDHKYDPISQKDYYAMAGVFASSGFWEYNLASRDEVDSYRAQMKKVKELETGIRDYADVCAIRVAETLSGQIPEYLMAARRLQFSQPKLDAANIAAEQNQDKETLQRWIKYLSGDKEHPYLKAWDALMASGGGTDAEARQVAERFRDRVQAVIAEKRGVNDANREMRSNYQPDPGEERVLLPGDLMQFSLFQYKQKLVEKTVDKNTWYVWRDIVAGFGDFNRPRKDAILEYKGSALLRFLTAEEKAKLEAMQAEDTAMTKAMPGEYPYLMGLRDNPAPTNVKLNLRGSPHALGPEVQRGFPAILGHTDADPLPFQKGSGRLELADAIVRHPLTARVIVNRVWMHHFGRGIVNSPANFGLMGDRPSHPELLDYLASRLIENHWSLKSLHREIVLSATYRLSVQDSEANAAKDPENQFLWRANLRRLDAEALRDSLLFATGVLDERASGGPAQDLNGSKRRTVYVRSGRTPDKFLQLFDFSGPALAGEQRNVTNVPQQALFFLNSDMMARQAELFTARIGAEAVSGQEEKAAKIQTAYRLLYGRDPSFEEVKKGIEFLKETAADAPRMSPWQQYTQILLSSPEFYYIN